MDQDLIKALIEEQSISTDINPALSLATAEQESNYDPLAVSHAGAAGVMQLMPETARRLGVSDRFDPEQNIKGGTALLKQELDYFGDERLALAAYNTGRSKVVDAIKKAGSTDYDDVQNYLYAETRNYVPSVMARYEKIKGNKPTPNADTDSHQGYLDKWGTVPEFADSLEEMASDPEFISLDTTSQIRKIGQLYNSQKWVPEVNNLLQSATTELWKGAEPREIPDLEKAVGPLPLYASGEEASKSIDDVESSFKAELRKAGTPSELFGTQVDDYFAKTKADELDRIDTRDRGYVGEAFKGLEEVVKGTATPIAQANAIIPSLLGFTKTGEAIRNIPTTVFGNTPREFAYQTDSEGRILHDEYGEPKTKIAGMALNLLGQVGGMFAGGFAAKAAGYTDAGIGAVLGGVNTAVTMDMAYTHTRDNGGTQNESVMAAVLAAPAAAAQTFAELAIIGAPKQYLSELSGLQKAKALAGEITKASVTGAAGQGVLNLGIQGASSIALGKNIISLSELATNTTIGGIVGGVAGGIQVSPRIAKAGEKPVIPIQDLILPDANEQTRLAKEFDEFSYSSARTKDVDIRHPVDVPHGLAELFDYEITPVFDKKITLTKKTDYVPGQIPPGEDGVNLGIDTLIRELNKTPAPEEISGLIRTRDKSQKDLDTFPKEDRANIQNIANERRKVENEIERSAALLESGKYDDVNNERFKQSIERNKGILKEMDKTIKDAGYKVKEIQRIGRLPEINESLKEPLANPGRYVNNIKAKEAHLEELLAAREKLKKESSFTGSGTPHALNYGKYEIYPKDGRWQVAEKGSGKVEAAAPFFKQARDYALGEKPFVEKSHTETMEKIQKAGGKGGQKFGLGTGSYKEAVFEAKKPLSSRGRGRIEIFPPNYAPNQALFTPEVTFTLAGKKAIPVTDVIKKVAGVLKALKLPTNFASVGGPIPNGVLGYLNFVKDYIRLAHPNDITAFTHETFHAIDQAKIGKWDKTGNGTYQGLPPEVVDGLKETANVFYPAPNQINASNIIQEGLAMFGQHYVTGQSVHKEVLNWWNTAFKAEHPDVHAAVESLKDVAHAYRDQSTENYLRQQRSATKPGFLARTYKTLFEDWHYKWRGMGEILKTVDKFAGSNVYGVYESLMGNARTTAKYFVENGVIGMNGERRVGLSAMQALAPAKGNYERLADYMFAKRAISYGNRNIEPGVSLVEAADFVKAIEFSNTAGDKGIVAAANNLYKWQWDVLTTAAERSPLLGHIVSKILDANMEATGTPHGYYVPFVREGKAGGPQFGKGITGSYRRIENPLKHLGNYAENLFALADRRYVLEQLVRLGDNSLGNSVGPFVRQIDPQLRVKLEKEFEAAIKDTTYGKDLHAESPMFAMEIASLLSPNRGASKAAEGYSIYAFPNGKGKVKFYEIADKVTQAFDTSLPDFVSNPIYRTVISGPRNLLRAGATTYRASYQLKNLIARDFLTLYRRSNTNNPFTLIKDVSMSLLNGGAGIVGSEKSFGMKPWYDLAERLGVTGATRSRADAAINAEIESKTGLKVIDLAGKGLQKVEEILSLGEQASRIAAVRGRAAELGITDIEAPLTPAQAMELRLAYKRSTTNFSIQGKYARVVNTAVPFFTARIAEVSALPQDLRTNPGKHAALGLGMLTAGLYQAFENHEKDWYQNLDPETLAQNALFEWNVGGENRLVKIPLESWSAIFWGIGQSAGGALIRSDDLKPSAKEYLQAYAKGFMPLNSPYDLLGVAGKEAIQQATNKDYYFNKRIVPKSLENAPKARQYTDYTTELSKRVGSLINYSPALIDHGIRSVFPAGLDALQATERMLGVKPDVTVKTSNPLVNAFVHYALPQGITDRATDKFYDLLSTYQENKDEETPEQEKIRKRLNHINEDIGAMHAVLSTKPDPELRDRIFEKKKELLEEAIQLAEGNEPEKTQDVQDIVSQGEAVKRERKKAKKVKE